MTEYKKNSNKRSLATIIFTMILCTSSLLEFSTASLGTYSPFLALSILSGLILGGIHGAGSVGLYIILGCTGLKIFPGSNEGIIFLTSPEGGILIAGFISSLSAGLILGTPQAMESSIKNKQSIKILIAITFSFILGILTYTMWHLTGITNSPDSTAKHIYSSLTFFEKFNRSFHSQIIPLLSFTIINLIISFFITLYTRPAIGKILYPNDKKEMENLISTLKTKMDKKKNRKEFFKTK